MKPISITATKLSAQTQKYFSKFLNVSPFSLALWRAEEARAIFSAYKDYLNDHRNKRKLLNTGLKPPVLDVGCGFGEFAGIFFDSQVEVGIDINIDDLTRARTINKYKKLIMADARKLPFRNNFFSTVISVSVLEHMSHPEKCIKEIYRVLKPGGIFIFTVPTKELNQYLFYPNLFNWLGLKKIANYYIDLYHRIFKHISLFDSNKWIKIINKHGFKVLRYQGTFSANLTRIFDVFLITALPSQITRWMFGYRWIWALDFKKKILNPFYKHVTKDKKSTLSNIIVMVEKPK